MLTPYVEFIAGKSENVVYHSVPGLGTVIVKLVFKECYCF